MTSLREFILQQSTLDTGSTVRDHINNPGSSGPATGLLSIMEITAEMTTCEFEVEIDDSYLSAELVSESLVAELDTADLTAEVEILDYDVEVCI